MDTSNFPRELMINDRKRLYFGMSKEWTFFVKIDSTDEAIEMLDRIPSNSSDETPSLETIFTVTFPAVSTGSFINMK